MPRVLVLFASFDGQTARIAERIARALARAGLEVTTRPGAFFSVCLSAGGPGARPATAARYREEFRRRSRWHPQLQASFAGALPYSRYNPIVRLMMRLIVGAAGGDTDTSRDYEYTDWGAVEHFAAAFAVRVAAAPG